MQFLTSAPNFKGGQLTPSPPDPAFPSPWRANKFFIPHLLKAVRCNWLSAKKTAMHVLPLTVSWLASDYKQFSP